MQIPKKILVLQLARLGDILQTWPAMRALRRAYPEAEITYVCRKKFAGAVQDLEAIDKTVVFDTEEYFEPLLRFQPSFDDSLGKLRTFCSSLRAEKFDLVINYTFSPFSSYMAQLVGSENSHVLGYSRTADGYLHISGDTSAYFYAQVGVERHNRIHLCDLFAMMVDVDLTPQDWAAPKNLPAISVPGDYVVLHIGASDDKKMYTIWKWQAVVQRLLKAWAGSVVLIGHGEKEEALAQRVQDVSDDVRILSFVGKTSIADTMGLISKAKLYVGCDSGPLHIANLVGTRSLNISFKTVRYWETGPRVSGSAVLYSDSQEEMPSDRVVSQIVAMLTGQSSVAEAVTVNDQMIAYQAPVHEGDDFGWNMLQAIYLGNAWPTSEKKEYKLAIQRLSEMNTVMIEQLQKIETPTQAQSLMEILNRGDDVISTIGKLEPACEVLVRWYQTEKARIGPGDFGMVLGETARIHGLFGKALDAIQGIQRGEIHEEHSGY